MQFGDRAHRSHLHGNNSTDITMSTTVTSRYASNAVLFVFEKISQTKKRRNRDIFAVQTCEWYSNRWDVYYLAFHRKVLNIPYPPLTCLNTSIPSMDGNAFIYLVCVCLLTIWCCKSQPFCFLIFMVKSIVTISLQDITLTDVIMLPFRLDAFWVKY